MAEYHRVHRAFQGEVLHLTGEAVRPDLWPTGRKLIDQKYIAPGPVGSAPIPCPCGRMWDGEVVTHPCEDASSDHETDEHTETRRGPGRPPKKVA